MSSSLYADNLKFIRRDNVNKIIIAHLNINSIRNKFNFLVEKINDNVDLLMVSETKLDDTFPTDQFIIDGFNAPFRLDRNGNGGGIMLFVREGIPAKFLSFATSPTEGFFVELNLRKKNGLFVALIIQIRATYKLILHH